MAFFRYRTLQFLYGLEANLPSSGYNVGEPYFTTDEGHLYIAKSPTEKVKFYNSVEVDTLLAKSVTGLYQGKHRYFGTQEQIKNTTGNIPGDTAIASDGTSAGQIGAKGTFDGTSWTFAPLQPTPQNGMYADIEALLDYPYPSGTDYLPGEIRWSDDGINPPGWVQLPESRNAPDEVTIAYNSQGQVSLKPVSVTTKNQQVQLKFGDILSTDLTTFNTYGQASTETVYAYTLPNYTFTAATTTAAGQDGLVPAPASSDESLFLSAKGDWRKIATALNVIDVDTSAFSPDGSVAAGDVDVTGNASLVFLNGLLCLPDLDYSLTYSGGALTLQWLKTEEIPTADSWLKIFYFA